MTRGRRIGVAALLVLGTFFWTAFGLGLWAQRQLLDSDNWVDTSGQLLENEAIRVALAGHLVDSLYENANVEQRLEETLRPPLNQLAAPAAAGLKQVAVREAPRVLGTAAALNAWEKTNREVHAALLAVVRGDVAGRGVTLDLDEMLQQVADGSGLPPGAVDKLPSDIADLQLARPEQLDTAEKALDVLEELPWVLFGLALMCFAGVLWLGSDRRRTILDIGICLIVAGIVVLALRRLGERALIDSLANTPNSGAAADEAWNIGTSLMVDAAYGSMLLGFFVVSGAWLAGPARWAEDVRRFASPVFREHFGLVRTGLGVLLLLLVIWGPVPWTTKVIPILIFTGAAFAWLEWTRVRTLAEFRAEPTPPRPTARPEPTGV